MLHLCATARLAQTLKSRPGDAAAPVWTTPQALTLGAWLDQMREEALLAGLIAPTLALDPVTEQLVWERIIADSLTPAEAALFDLGGLAASAAEAHALVVTWNLHPRAEEGAEETRRFLAWQETFRQRCRSSHWQNTASRQVQTVALIEAGQLPLPPAVTFAGFDRLTPLEQRLRRALAARGVACHDAAANPQPEDAHRALACADRGAECRAAAAWARAELERNPAARLAIVAPDLAGVRNALAFALDDALHPQAVHPGSQGLTRCYNISLGTPLADQPIVRTALDLLAAAVAGKVEQARLSQLLRTPQWSAGAAEADGRALLDRALREELEFLTTLPALVRLARRHGRRHGLPLTRLIRDLEALLAARQAAGPSRRPLSAWHAVFAQWLQALRWPGDRPLSSDEYQTRQALLELLTRHGPADDILGPVSAGEALRRLGQLCRDRVFQAQTRGQPALQVLGVLESGGLDFDALWVLGLNDHVWPPPARPNPLLPAELQRRAGTPHGSAETELAFAGAVQQRLRAAAPRITFSFASGEGNRLLRPSPLLAGIPLSSWTPPSPGAGRRPPLEALHDDCGPPVAPGETVGGGTGLLKAQAICPAWAFFQYRLGARALGVAVEGLDPMARGTLVHAALEHFWRQVGSQETLRALAPEALAATVAAAVTAALTDFETASHRQLPARYRGLEGERLQALVHTWLAVEGARTAAFTVRACEREVVLEIEGIRVRTVIDRIDALADGRLLIIDYKTGRSIDLRNWAGDRLSEPQLPIYAALALPTEDGAEVAGAAFAKVRMDQPGFAGISDHGGLLPGVPGLGDGRPPLFDPQRFPDWPAVLHHWRERLHAIAREIRAGEAAVRFADANALRHCEVLPLLRLAERQQQLAAAGEAADV